MRLSSTFLSLARSSFFLEVRVFETRVRFKKTFDAGVERLPRDPQRLRQSLDRVRFRVEPAPGDFFDGRFHCLGLLRVFDKLSSLLTHVDQKVGLQFVTCSAWQNEYLTVTRSIRRLTPLVLLPAGWPVRLGRAVRA